MSRLLTIAAACVALTLTIHGSAFAQSGRFAARPSSAGLRFAIGQTALADRQNDATLQKGNEAYQYWCATCHGRGPGHPGTVALTAKYKGALSGLLEERADLTPQTVRFAVRRGTSIMPFFRKTEVSDANLDAIAQYLTTRTSPRR